MNQASNEASWISVHIFFKGEMYGKECDEVILKIVEPLIDTLNNDKLIEKYFFIRYSDLGPHVRLRLYGNSKTLNTKVKDKVGKFIKKNFPYELMQYPTLPDSTPQDKNYLWIDYEPEIDRYGGEDAIKVAEEFFFHSSAVAIKLIEEIQNGDKSSRLGKGLLTMLILLKVFAEKKILALEWITSYGKNYLKIRAKEENELKEWETVFNKGFDKQSKTLVEYTYTVWEVLDAGEELNPVLDYYKKRLTEISKRLTFLLSQNEIVKQSNPIKDLNTLNSTIISSYIHMMNNRLGISIPEESYLSHLITKSLKIIEEADEPRK